MHEETLAHLRQTTAESQLTEADVREVAFNLTPGTECDAIVDGNPCRAYAGTVITFDFLRSVGTIRLHFAICPRHFQQTDPHSTRLEVPKLEAIRVFNYWYTTLAGQTFLARVEQLKNRRS